MKTTPKHCAPLRGWVAAWAVDARVGGGVEGAMRSSTALDSQTLTIVVVWADTELSAVQQSLLGAVFLGTPLGSVAGERPWIGPRTGQRSPWGARVTSLLLRLGLSEVRAVERFRGVTRDAWVSDPQGTQGVWDRMTEQVYPTFAAIAAPHPTPIVPPVRWVSVSANDVEAIRSEAARLGVSFTPADIELVVQIAGHNGLSDVAIMMVAQLRSDHCRHRTFGATWRISSPQSNGEQLPDVQPSLFSRIRQTHARRPAGTLSAYTDNAAVLEGGRAGWWGPDGTGRYRLVDENTHLLLKVETHNHPTGIAPWPGAATGSGGELRDEGATGRGGRPHAGVLGLMVSHLHLPGLVLPWENNPRVSPNMASAWDILRDAPLGAAAYNNRFGRPLVAGCFRSFETEPVVKEGTTTRRGFHKPVLLAGGVGHIRPMHIHKAKVPAGAVVGVLGGPAYSVGIGGGSASSQATGVGTAALDWASVQRADAEMQRRCQAVLDVCIGAGDENPVLSIHDVGAGGLANAIPEVVFAAGLGANINLRAIPSGDVSMSPLALWCNEAQERYVVMVAPECWATFVQYCAREGAPVACVGHTVAGDRLRVADENTGEVLVNVSLTTLLGPVAEEVRRDTRRVPSRLRVGDDLDLMTLLLRVLRHPSVASKAHLVTIADRSVGGCVVAEPMVGAAQVPVGDVGVTVSTFWGTRGEAIALGERAPVALENPAAAARLAVAEALTNLCAADCALSQVVLSANWMADAGTPGEGAALVDAVGAVADSLCAQLGISIPVGKDSMSMKAQWSGPMGTEVVVAPSTLIVTALAPVEDVRRTWTPALRAAELGPTVLLHVDLAGGKTRLGGSIAQQVVGGAGGPTADLDVATHLVAWFHAARRLRDGGLVLAYHDISDGGLAVCVLEMAFAGRASVTLTVDARCELPARLFAEEPGCVLEVAANDVRAVCGILAGHGLSGAVCGSANAGDRVRVVHGDQEVLECARARLMAAWSAVSLRVQHLRDGAECANEAEAHVDADVPKAHVPFVWKRKPAKRGLRPAVGILREQGVNGHREMAAAFDAAGFAAIDIPMADLRNGKQHLDRLAGLAVCGGFSYGDVLGAGRGWALSILYEPLLAAQFASFFHRDDTFTLGVCNGCQMLAELRSLIPGAEGWPQFGPNRSGRFEARQVWVQVEDSPSVLFAGMAGSRLPVVVAHGEGRVVSRVDPDTAPPVLRYIDANGPTERYPANPNGSKGGHTAYTTPDGRATILMPHPERVFRSYAGTCAPNGWHPDGGPWLRLFQNARTFVDRVGGR